MTDSPSFADESPGHAAAGDSSGNGRGVPLLEMSRIAKSFGGTKALAGVSLSVRRGEVLALIGENGAGKSTLMKVLSGAHPPDMGSMKLDGLGYAPRGPHDARVAGVAMIYQELNLAPDLSVEDNIMLGLEDSAWGLLRRGRQRDRVLQALSQLGHRELQPSTKVRDLSVGAQQLVEIARALVHRAKVLVFDEPTSSLPRADVDHLFAVIARLREAGHGIIYISHFLEEIREVAGTYSVLRDGENAGDGDLAEVTDAEIVSMMVGRQVDQLFPQVPHQPAEVRLEINRLSGQQAPRDFSLDLRRGEIVGIAGLVGAGRTETLRCLIGLDPRVGGQVTLDGRPLNVNPRSCMRVGVGLLSEDRKGEGLAQGMTIDDNITLSHLMPYSHFGFLSLRQKRSAVQRWMEKLSVKARSGDQPVWTLSGGNQQKVALARVLHQDSDVLLLDEPTKGIDVGTKAEIYSLMGQLAAEGKSILFVSSYLPELIAVCDRIAVLARGRLQEVRDVDNWTQEAIMTCAVAVEQDE